MQQSAHRVSLQSEAGPEELDFLITEAVTGDIGSDHLDRDRFGDGLAQHGDHLPELLLHALPGPVVPAQPLLVQSLPHSVALGQDEGWRMARRTSP